LQRVHLLTIMPPKGWWTTAAKTGTGGGARKPGSRTSPMDLRLACEKEGGIVLHLGLRVPLQFTHLNGEVWDLTK